MSNPLDTRLIARENALQIDELVRTRQKAKSAGEDVSALDLRIKPFKAMYVKAGTKYGGNYSGMLKWFNELTQDPPAANQP